MKFAVAGPAKPEQVLELIVFVIVVDVMNDQILSGQTEQTFPF